MLAAAHRARLVVVHVIEPAATDEARTRARCRLEDSCAELATTTLLLEGPPAEQILDAARAEAADLVIVGSKGLTGIVRVWLGSVAEKVARTSLIPVLVSRGVVYRAIGKILVATDFSEPAERAFALAIEVAPPDATFELLHVLDSARPATGENEAQRQVAALLSRHARPQADLRFEVAVGAPGDQILRRLEQGHGLVALGTHGRHGLARLLLGSVAQTIVRGAPCSVLISR